MYSIGVISDTHGLLREEVKKELEGCDAILHAGDINKEKVVDELQKIAPLYVVRGNADKEWAANLPQILETELFGIRIKMIHNRKELEQEFDSVDLVIYGHSHKYADEKVGNVRFLNPGSCGPRRFHQPVTMAVIEVSEKGDFNVKRIDILQPPHEAKGEIKAGEKKQDLHRTVELILKDVDRGKSVAEISKVHGIELKFTEQVCRMYLTHPGVDVDGILNRIYGVNPTG